MEAGALGAEIVLSGKVTGARSRVEKFNRGYIKHNGEPAEDIVDSGVGVAVMKLGTIGVQVKIIPPNAQLPDDFEVYDDVEVEDFVADTDGESVEELLEGEPEEATEAEDAADEATEADDAADAVDEEVIEEDVEVPTDDDVEDVDVDELEEAVDEELDEETEAEAEELMDEMDDADEASDDDEQEAEQ
jgi:small subunit ribosomal protein S3